MASRFHGHVDTVAPVLAGWVVDRERPAEPVRLIVTIDETWQFAIAANRSRPDVAAAGFGGPDCGFELELPAHLFDGSLHDIVMTTGTGAPLDMPGWQPPVVLGPVTAEIVPITLADVGTTTLLLRQTYIEGNMSAAEIATLTPDYIRQWIAQAPPAAGGVLLGARVGERLVAYAMLEPGGGHPAIAALSLSVLRQYRRNGLGERLMRALMLDTRQRGKIDEIWLSVEPSNLPARQLYEKLGFERATPPPRLFVPANFIVMLWRPDAVGHQQKGGA